ncbi:MAG TPA: HlyD family efflux transporter periplasmic adaptor subunit [Dongiaceae bacterium]|nr:HlyD family efflux transporter periplasmic adaptor subunit [Dongiaceae bacterium]
MRYSMLAGGLLALVLAGCQERQHQALGTLERDRISQTATAAEIVVELPVTEGTQVQQGQLLVRLDDTGQKARVARAEADVAAAEAELDKLRSGAREEELAAAQASVAEAKAALVESEANFVRAKTLVAKNLTSQMTFDRERANRDSAEARWQNAKERLRQLTNGSREEDLRRGEANLRAAQASLALEQKTLGDLTINATRDGVLDSLPWNLGERVAVGSPLAVVLAGKAPFARVHVPEPFRVQIKVGDTLRVAVDGLEQPIEGKVRWIATEPSFTPYYALNQEDRSRLMYLAEVQLPDSSADLPTGLPAQVLLP